MRHKLNDYVHAVLFKDLTASVSGARVPPSSAPSSTNFGPAHTPQRQEFAFGVGDYVFIESFHINHDIKYPTANVAASRAYIHVHWSTDGTDTGNVRWEITIDRALGHDQANFGTITTIELEQAAAGTAWRHMIVEASEDDALSLLEPDELILVTLRRIAASTDECTDAVFAIQADFHYESDRHGTPTKAPDFYS